jgi:hypothetical protein
MKKQFKKNKKNLTDKKYNFHKSKHSRFKINKNYDDGYIANTMLEEYDVQREKDLLGNYL